MKLRLLADRLALHHTTTTQTHHVPRGPREAYEHQRHVGRTILTSQVLLRFLRVRRTNTLEVHNENASRTNIKPDAAASSAWTREHK